ncbi:hypothetical protein [Nostoc sp.]|uniref:hypothetical protein n=1 Tax=Nostoc sp. TaxID=1180 RepID=UPI002FF5ABE1
MRKFCVSTFTSSLCIFFKWKYFLPYNKISKSQNTGINLTLGFDSQGNWNKFESHKINNGLRTVETFETFTSIKEIDIKTIQVFPEGSVFVEIKGLDENSYKSLTIDIRQYKGRELPGWTLQQLMVMGY